MSDPLPVLTTSEALARLVERARALGREPLDVLSGQTLLHEGDENRDLYILLEGTAQLVKRGVDGERIPVDLLGPGSLLGILSFWTGRPAFSDSLAATPLRVLRLDKGEVDRGVEADPMFARLIQQLLVANLSDRYRRVVGLNLKVAGLTRELESERNALREAVADLKRTRNKLVHQEKLATMGQLLAGIAHEINNPSSALMKNAEQLRRDLPMLFAHDPKAVLLLNEGLNAPWPSTAETRDRMETLARRWPALPRSTIRRLAKLTSPALDALGDPPEGEKMERALRLFETGAALHGVLSAETRITRLVKSLKSYSRQDETGGGSAKLEECVRDTLTVLNHRLKHYDLRLELEDVPEIPCHPGEINQILTNLLANACDATEPGGGITVRTGQTDDRVWLEVSDEGCGLPPSMGDRIFDANVTTKSGGGNFGLGLGLAISRDIAVKHHGTLTSKNASTRGAVFRLELPR